MQEYKNILAQGDSWAKEDTQKQKTLKIEMRK